MCSPTAIMVMSSLYAAQQSASAQKNVNDARNEAATFEAQRQDGYGADIEARVDEQLTEMQGGAGALRQQLLDERNAVIEKNYDGDISQFIPALTTANEVKPEYGRQLNKSLQKGRDTAIAKAKLGSYGDLNAANALTRLQGQSDISRYLDFARGSQNAFGVELDAAASAGDRQKFNAEIARGIGSVASAQAGKNSRYSAVPGDADYPMRDPKYDYYRGRR